MTLYPFMKDIVMTLIPTYPKAPGTLLERGWYLLARALEFEILGLRAREP